MTPSRKSCELRKSGVSFQCGDSWKESCAYPCNVKIKSGSHYKPVDFLELMDRLVYTLLLNSSCIWDTPTLGTIQISLSAQWVNGRTVLDLVTQVDDVAEE